MSAKTALFVVAYAFCLFQSRAHAQKLEASQEITLDRQGHAALWGLDIALDAPFREQAGARVGMRLGSWVSSLADLQVSWAQQPSLLRLGLSGWPIGDPLAGGYLALGPSLAVHPAAGGLELDAFAELGVRYGWEGLAFTVSARWDLRHEDVVPSLGLMIGYTFAGTT